MKLPLVFCNVFFVLILKDFAFLLLQLARATVRDPKTGVLTVANYRVSKR